MTLTRRRRRRSNSPFPDAHSAVSAQVPEPDGFEHVPRVEVREREEGREKIQPRVRPRASEPSASVRRPSSPRVSRRTEKKKTDAFALPLRLRLDSQMHAFAVGGQLQACGGAEWAWGVPIRRAPLPIRRAEVGEGSGADSSRTFEKIYSRFIDSERPRHPPTRASSSIFRPALLFCARSRRENRHSRHLAGPSFRGLRGGFSSDPGRPSWSSRCTMG